MLLDGDIFLYMVTTQCEEEIKWDLEEMKKAIREAADDHDKLVGG